jgi:hypothetical protein
MINNNWIKGVDNVGFEVMKRSACCLFSDSSFAYFLTLNKEDTYSSEIWVKF